MSIIMNILGKGLWHEGRGMAIDFLGDLIKILMGLDPSELFFMVLTLFAYKNNFIRTSSLKKAKN